MADRTIVLAQNKRHAVRGLTVVNPQEFSAYQEEDDNLTYIVDMSSYLDGATISSVTRAPTGVTVSNTSNTTTRITQRLKGFGYVDFKVTTSSGDVEEFRLVINQRASSSLQQIAQVPQEMPVAYTEARDPTNADDTIDGYVAGHVWINTLTNNVFDCISNTQGAAIWRHRPRILASSGSAVSVGATVSETVLATVTIPGNTIGVGGTLLVYSFWSCNNDASSKLVRVRLGGISGTAYTLQALASNVSLSALTQIRNRTTSTQIGPVSGQGAGGFAVSTSGFTTGSVDTTADQTLVLTGEKADSGDTLTLESYFVELVRPDIA